MGCRDPAAGVEVLGRLEVELPPPLRGDAHEGERVAFGLGSLSWALCQRFLAVVLAAFAALLLLLVVLARTLHVPVGVSGPGYLCPLELATVKAPMAAILDSICVSERARVAAGDTLVLLARSDLDIELTNARQEKVINDLRIAIAKEDLDRDMLRVAWETARQRRLVEIDSLAAEQARRVWRVQSPPDSVPPESAVREPYEWRQAVLRLEESRVALRLAQVDTMSIHSRKLEIEALRESGGSFEFKARCCEERVRRSVVTSPLSGIVFGRELRLRKGDSVPAGDVLLYVGRTDRWMMRCSVADRDVAAVAQGQQARVYIDALPYLVRGVFTGAVVAIGSIPRSDSSGSTYEVEIELSDDRLAPLISHPECVYGLRGSAVIVVMRPTALRYAWMTFCGNAGRRLPTHVRSS